MKWRTLIPKEGGVIHVDIDGDPSISTGLKQSSGNLLFLVVFRLLNFWGHFEGLNEVFSGSGTIKKDKGSDGSPKMNILYDTFPKIHHAPRMEIICQSYAPRNLKHQTTKNGVHKTIDFSSSRVRVLDFIYSKIAFGSSL